MFSSFDDLLARLDSPAGGMVFSLLVLIVLAGSYLLLARRRQLQGDKRPGRAILALIGLRLLPLPLLALAWLGDDAIWELAPTIERTILLVSAVVLTWLWTLDRQSRRVKQILVLTLVAALGFGLWGFSFWWQTLLASGYNSMQLNQTWNLISLPLLVGMLWVVNAGSEGVERGGLLQLGILLAGQTAHYLLADPGGHMPVWAQVAQLVALPLLYSFTTAGSDEAKDLFEAEHEAGREDLGKAGSASPAGEEDLDRQWLAQEVEARGPSKSMLEELHELAELVEADIVLKGNIDFEAMDVEIEGGFDRRNFAVVPPFALLLSQLPKLSATLARRRNLRLNKDEDRREPEVIGQALKLERPMHTWVQPLESTDSRQEIAILLRQDRPWTEADEERLLGERTREQAQETAAVPEADIELADERRQKGLDSSLLSRLRELEKENERYRQDVDRLLEHVDRLEQKTGAASDEVVQALREQNEELKSALSAVEAAPGTAESPGLPANLIEAQEAKEELRLALQETAKVRARLDELEQAIETGEPLPGSSKAIPEEKAEVIASIAQELRQPLSSILGYTDLLLGESVGILGALQRNFLERVRASTGRMNSLIEDLIRLAELDIAGYEVERKPVDLNSVIDDAISLVREQLQEKRIVLRVDLPRQLPPLQSDRDALQQIFYHLLQNADATTPEEGDITLRAFAESSDEVEDYVLVQVSDSGGGIPEGDLARVFSRVYRAQNPFIQGVGDSGVGLTIAETLTEALGGRIWVESEEGVGATFSVLLPLQQSPEETQPN